MNWKPFSQERHDSTLKMFIPIPNNLKAWAKNLKIANTRSGPKNALKMIFLAWEPRTLLGLCNSAQLFKK